MFCHDRVTALTSQDSDLFENSERYRQDESSSPCTTTLSFIQFIRNLISLKTDSHMASRCVHLRDISFLMTCTNTSVVVHGKEDPSCMYLLQSARRMGWKKSI
jgi:hypothetical protein